MDLSTPLHVARPVVLAPRRALWMLWLAFWLVLFTTVFGRLWDGYWHITYAFDGFWSPPHVFVYTMMTLTGLIVMRIIERMCCTL